MFAMNIKVAKFQYNWRIGAFADKMDSQRCFRSPNFVTDLYGKEFVWCLCFKKYTDTDRFLPGYHGIYLELLSPPGALVHAKAKFHFITGDSETSHNMDLDRKFFTATVDGNSHGISYYVRMNKVRQLITQDGSANFHCVLFIEEGDFLTSCMTPLADGRSRTGNSATYALLRKILEGEKRYSDIDITSSDGVTFHCHKAILSENEYFFRNFETDTHDTRSSQIHLNDISSDVLKELLRYLYTGKVENLAEVAQGLMYAAEKYMLDPLKELCEEELMRNLNADNCTTLLMVADGVRANALKDRCIAMVLAERRCVIQSRQWDQVLKREDLVNEIIGNIKDRAIFLGLSEVTEHADAPGPSAAVNL